MWWEEKKDLQLYRWIQEKKDYLASFTRFFFDNAITLIFFPKYGGEALAKF